MRQNYEDQGNEVRWGQKLQRFIKRQEDGNNTRGNTNKGRPAMKKQESLLDAAKQEDDEEVC